MLSKKFVVTCALWGGAFSCMNTALPCLQSGITWLVKNVLIAIVFCDTSIYSLQGSFSVIDNAGPNHDVSVAFVNSTMLLGLLGSLGLLN